MARPGKFDRLKPEVLRLLAEGLGPKEILAAMPELPQSTVYNWAKEFGKNSRTQGSKRMPLDPESPLERIINALWDLHQNPTIEGAPVQVQVLNALLRAEQIRQSQTVSAKDSQPKDKSLDPEMLNRIRSEIYGIE